MNNILLICQACLSKERELFPISKLQDLLINVDIVDLNLNYEGGLCWECKRIILKFSRFRKQVELAQISLQHKERLQDLTCLSTLSCTVASVYSYSALEDFNSETIDQPNDLKQEIENARHSSDCDYNEKLELDSDIYAQENEIKKELKIKKKVKKIARVKEKSAINKSSDYKSEGYNDVKDKFVEVEFTEEEMIKGREEKRNHPNFKKLPYSCDTCVLGFTRKENYDFHKKRKHSLLNYEGGLCWECKRIILKFSRFRKQVELAQISLQHKERLQDLTCLSTLSCTVASVYSYSALEDFNSETIDQPNDLKQEIENARHSSDCDYNEKLELDSDIYAQENEIKKELKIKKKVKKIARVKEKSAINKSSDYKSEGYNDVKDKFVEVEFTEEEMIKGREEKRNHPNFKKLPYSCDTCVLGFTRKENYDFHKKRKHSLSTGPYICPVCQVHFSSLKTLTKHVKKHYHCYRCKLCVYETTELWSVLSHCRSKHSGDSEDCIHCLQCNYIAKGREELAEHTKTQHSLNCKICGEKFKGPGTLRTHLRRIHGSGRPHACGTCGRGFRSRTRLEAHVTSHDGGSRLSYCVTCQVQYKNIYVYRNHLATSARHSARKYHCEECGKKFASKVYYKRHYTFYHEKKSPFKCELCNRLFISAWRLRNHRQMKHGMARTRNHACDDCGKKFYTRSTLSAHRLTHSAQRSFMCAHCGDTFKQRPALYTHTRLVHRPTRLNDA